MSEGLGEISTCNEGGFTLIILRVKINQEMNNFIRKILLPDGLLAYSELDSGFWNTILKDIGSIFNRLSVKYLLFHPPRYLD